jgi:hypothetical protein
MFTYFYILMSCDFHSQPDLSPLERHRRPDGALPPSVNYNTFAMLSSDTSARLDAAGVA